MDFKDGLLLIADRALKLKDSINTEEATKTSLVLPFINNLGYDVFNPLEVIPECDCDYGTKKGEKIDYTICLNGQPIMLVECKHWKEDLSRHQAQLFRYFHVSPAKFGLLTNGLVYKFFSDLEVPNKMDDKPFFEVDLLNLKDSHIDKLKEFCRNSFDIDSILNTANELKYVNAIRSYLIAESNNPTEDFVKFITKQVYSGMVTKTVLEQFSPMVKRAFQQFTNDFVNDRLKSALTPDVPPVDVDTSTNTTDEDSKKDANNKIVTTEEELQGFYIVRAILCNTVELNRVCQRDAQSYFAILFDDNNRKPICRLHFNGSKKYIETFDIEKVGTKHPIEALSDIYNYSKELTDIATYYNSEK